ncbi:nitroreductase [Streptomyces sp. NPDC047981]|uniref:nitroreductase n=1 Tax=Streptomyces sp. NPDC047981 TaxID=3154610 RepID=UPI003434E595
MTYEDDGHAGGGLRNALALARSTREPGPDFPAGPAVARRPGAPIPVPGSPAAVLTAALAGERLRPAASAGALHPVNAHLLVGPGEELAPGRYAYDPVTDRLHARGGAPADAPAGMAAVLTVTARRTVSHYGHRGWPLLLLDTGHALAALALAGADAYCADASGELLAAAAGLGTPSGSDEPEHALAAVWWGPGGAPRGDLLDCWAAHGSRDAPGGGPGRTAPGVLVAAWEALTEVTRSGGEGSWSGFPGLVGEAVRLGRGGRGGVPVSGGMPGRARTAGLGPDSAAGRGEASDDVAPASPAGAVRPRRSAAPGFHGIPAPAQLACLVRAVEAAGPDGVRWCLAVGGPEPAVLAGPGLRVLAVGDARPTLARWAAGQAWLAEAGAVLLAYGCPDDTDPARVRRAHLGAGYAVGLAQALACAAGLPSRPVGTWQSADLGAALGGPPDRGPVLHALAVGWHPLPAGGRPGTRAGAGPPPAAPRPLAGAPAHPPVPAQGGASS